MTHNPLLLSKLSQHPEERVSQTDPKMGLEDSSLRFDGCSELRSEIVMAGSQRIAENMRNRDSEPHSNFMRDPEALSEFLMVGA